MILKGIEAPIGDFCDWPSITPWASTIASALGV